MASASTSAPMLNDSRWYDVFLSFRGEDTRNSFTDHLYAALMRAGLRTFRDNDEIDRGQELKPEIEKAIIESRGSIVVLSEKYANSRWCLDELLLILEQKRSFNHFVLPVFYHVDPSDVRNQTQSFAIDVDEGVEGSKWTDYKVNRWKAALTEVADLTGMVVSGPEANFIAKVVDTIDRKLDLKLVSSPAHLIGMETRAKGINSWLENEESGANVVAICGMGGSGKTTLSQFIYNANKHKFGGSSYLEEIGKHCKEPTGLLQLQKVLLTDILGEKNASISSVSEGTSKIEDALQRKRVLIILDDIDELDQLGALLGTRASHTQSKIIITSRLLDIRAWFGSISWRCEVQNPELLNGDESLQLLCCHAFGSKTPMDGFRELAVQLAVYCAGSPLALKVLGSSLFVDAEYPQERSSMIKTWSSFLNSLSPLKGDLDDRILGILQRSFDSLPCISNKQLFLHIAFFFVGEYEDYVVKILEHDWQAKAGIMTLINRCLLTVSPSNKLMMHQLLQEMARTIVLKESKDPAKRSIVSQSDETYHLLEKGEGSETIEGLVLDMYRPNRSSIRELVLYKLGWPSALKTASIAKMGKLKLLKLVDVKLTGSYKKFPELRWLYWMGCPLEKIPSRLLGSSLVAFHMRGDLIKFEPPMVLHSLKFLHLTDCWQLVSVHKISRLPNLEILDLSGCSSLTHICEDIGGLENLVVLNLKGCDNLFKVPLNKKFIYQLQRLKAIYTDGEIPQHSLFPIPESVKVLDLQCCHLHDNRDVPVVFSDPPKLFYMSLGGNKFDFMPNNINLKGLQVLHMTGCHHLKSLLCLPNTLDTGDEVNVSIIMGNGLTVSGCSASLVYMDDDEVQLKYCKNYTKEEEKCSPSFDILSCRLVSLDIHY